MLIELYVSEGISTCLYMKTFFFWPSRQIRLIACKSEAGFQSKSNNINRDAPVKFSPIPPALALNKNTTAN